MMDSNQVSCQLSYDSYDGKTIKITLQGSSSYSEQTSLSGVELSTHTPVSAVQNERAFYPFIPRVPSFTMLFIILCRKRFRVLLLRWLAIIRRLRQDRKLIKIKVVLDHLTV